MIEELRIRGVGVIDEAQLELSDGLTVITGETGAGKTMILSGLELLRGARADVGVLREGTEGAEIDAVVSLLPATRPLVMEALSGAGLENVADDDPLIVRRTVVAGGRSRGHVAGHPVPISVLADLWAPLVAVHGQAEQARLREASWQRSTVDRFAGPELAVALDRYQQTWSRWHEVREELRNLRESLDERERTAALLRLGIAEIDDVEPEPGEDARLDAESEVLSHVGGLREAADMARRDLSGGDDSIDTSADTSAVITSLHRVIDQLTSMADVDERLAGLSQRLRQSATELEDVDSELGGYLRSLDADPERQAWVEHRRSRLAALRKAYGATIDDVLRWRATAATQVEEAGGDAERIESLVTQEQMLATAARDQASEVSTLRRTAATAVADAVTEELRALAMPDAHIDVQITTDLESLNSHGADVVQIALTPHSGAAPRPVGKGASGGELSRLALAFEVALAGDAPIPTMVFDEVDAGVGGAVAVEVGRRLARLARHTQVLVVTHLPQVAAFADHHVVVTKNTEGAITTANVREVTEGDRVAELVRMLSGLEGSETGAAHAQELLDAARRGGSATSGRGAPRRASASRARER